MCARCCKNKTVSEYYADKNMKYGLKSYCKECAHNDWQKRYNGKSANNMKRDRDNSRRKLKIEVMTYYGNDKCACVICGESRLACLSIDHINGGGFEQRQALGISGSSFHYWLKKQGFPDGYQTLCMNDQFIKREEKNENAHGRHPNLNTVKYAG